MEYLTTGNEIVDKIGKLNISGNVTPHIWYKSILRDNGKPYLLAIAILSDIVFWYRPTEVRDEISGQLLGWKKKFSSDLLQRSYEQLADMFGESKGTVTQAIIALEKLGVVERVFRTITVNGTKMNNVLFIRLDFDNLYKITYPEDNNSDTPIPKKKETYPEISGEGVPKKKDRCPEISGDKYIEYPKIIKEKNIKKKITEKPKPKPKNKSKPKANSFNSFMQNDYDEDFFNKLENML